MSEVVRSLCSPFSLPSVARPSAGESEVMSVGGVVSVASHIVVGAEATSGGDGERTGDKERRRTEMSEGGKGFKCEASTFSPPPSVSIFLTDIHNQEERTLSEEQNELGCFKQKDELDC
ncbi:hypothetical protein K1719_045801 [Acacia pycnantha]|nr:hypothetical protein K1719_045801 [Acacia pycnantha]